MKRKVRFIAALFCMGCLATEPAADIKAAGIQVAAAQTTLSADNSLEVLSLSAGTLSPDFTGKTVIPFMTNGGWPGHVIKDMKDKCKGAAFAHEMQIQFDSMGKDNLETSEDVITEWIGQINTDINK